MSTGTGFGTRVSNPSPCVLGKPCAFVLHLHDEFDRPLATGGMISNLTIRLNASGRQVRNQMHDNRDGTFTAVIPESWVKKPGSYLFSFYNGSKEFKPIMSGPHDLAVGFDCMNVPDGKYRKYGGDCTGLRTVDFKLSCEGSFAQLDQTGSSCVCKPGYERILYINSSEPLSCRAKCQAAERVSDDGASCVCADRYYDTDVHGVLVCNTGGWDTEKTLIAVQNAQRQRKSSTGPAQRCATECPAACTFCECIALSLPPLTSSYPAQMCSWRRRAWDSDNQAELAPEFHFDTRVQRAAHTRQWLASTGDL